jgi:hypothetical protein
VSNRIKHIFIEMLDDFFTFANSSSRVRSRKIFSQLIPFGTIDRFRI